MVVEKSSCEPMRRNSAAIALQIVMISQDMSFSDLPQIMEAEILTICLKANPFRITTAPRHFLLHITSICWLHQGLLSKVYFLAVSYDNTSFLTKEEIDFAPLPWFPLEVKWNQNIKHSWNQEKMRGTHLINLRMTKSAKAYKISNKHTSEWDIELSSLVDQHCPQNSGLLPLAIIPVTYGRLSKCINVDC